MDQHIQPLITSTTAASRFGITNDYVTMLARQKKIAGQLVDRVWYVEPSSLETFLEQMQKQRERKRVELSQKLRQEYRQKAALRADTEPPTPARDELPTINPFSLAPALAGFALFFVVGTLSYAASNASLEHVARTPLQLEWQPVARPVAQLPDELAQKLVATPLQAVADAFAAALEHSVALPTLPEGPVVVPRFQLAALSLAPVQEFFCSSLSWFCERDLLAQEVEDSVGSDEVGLALDLGEPVSPQLLVARVVSAADTSTFVTGNALAVILGEFRENMLDTIGRSVGGSVENISVTNTTTSSSGATALSGLSDVSVSSPADGEVLLYNGTDWENVATSSLGISGGSSFWSSASTGGIYYNGSKVGIGTTTPTRTKVQIVAPSNGDPALMLTNMDADTDEKHRWITAADDGSLQFGQSDDELGMSSVDIVMDINGRLGIGTTTPGTLLSIGGDGFNQGINISDTATSTFGFGINVLTGCFAVNGVCISGGGSSQWTTSSSNIYYNTGNVGLGTTTPYAKLSVVGEAVARNFTATSTTATSTFAGGLNVGNGALTYDYSAGLTTIQNLAFGSMSFEADSGIVSWFDMPVTSSASAGTVESYTAYIDGLNVLTVYGEADGVGGARNLRVGVGTTSPQWPVNIYSTSTSQLALSAGPGVAQWAFRNAGGNLYLSTTTVAGTATTSLAALTINGTTGNVGIGTTSPYAKLSVVGQIVTETMFASSTTSSATPLYGLYSWQSNTGSGSAYGFYGRGETSGDGGAVGGQFVGASNSASAVTAYGAFMQASIANTTSGSAMSAYADAPSLGFNRYGVYAPAVSGGGGVNASVYAGGTALFAVTSGSVGIGTTSPSNLLHAEGTGATIGTFYRVATAANVSIEFKNNTTSWFSGLNSDGNFALDTDNNIAGSPKLTLTSGGALTVASCSGCSSDARLKTNIEDLPHTDIIQKLLALRPVSFNWAGPVFGVDMGSTTQFGFIAQEAQEVFPDLVLKDRETELTPGGTYLFNYQGLISPLVIAVQEIWATITGFAEKFTTKELCVEDVCVTRDQFLAMVQAAGIDENEVAEEPAPESVESESEEVGEESSEEVPTEGEESVEETPAEEVEEPVEEEMADEAEEDSEEEVEEEQDQQEVEEGRDTRDE